MRTPTKYNVTLMLFVSILTIEEALAENLLTASTSSHNASLPCNFTRDCNSYQELLNIQNVDVTYSCNFGQCIQSSPLEIKLNPEVECESFKDCECR